MPDDEQLNAADIVIHGGTVVNSNGSRPASVVIRDGRITAVLEPGFPLPVAGRIIDADGQYIIPGGVDPHCHINQRLGAYTHLDDYEQASIAALHGGTTTVIDFAIPDTYDASPLQMVKDKRAEATQSRCDTNLHGSITQWTDTTEAEIDEMLGLGVRTIKLFTTYEDMVMAGPSTMLRVLEKLRDSHGLTYVHAEGDHIVQNAQRHAREAGTVGADGHATTRPEIAEETAVAEVLATAEYLDAPVYFVHQTTPDAVDLVRRARQRGVRAYTESCPHYLSLTEEVYGGPYPERFVCAPPIRSAATVAELQQRALAGEIDTIGSDHCCYDTAQKLERRDDVTEMPNGLPGVETRLPVSYTQLVHDLGMPIERFVAMFSTNVAKLNGLETKGFIGAGADADVVLFDPQSSKVARAEDLHMQTDYTPYEGKELFGWPSVVISQGTVVLDAGGFHDPGPVGRQLYSADIPAQLLTR